MPIEPYPFRIVLASELQAEWERVLRAGVQAQQIVGAGIAVGGTASVLYAEHRLSTDTDHLLPDLRGHFDQVLASLEGSPKWETARLNRPVLILGNIDGVEVGFRQVRRSAPVSTVDVPTP
ncbi:hypothetical protein BH11ARM2_BH11ARM2_02820 [soil metagenome]